MSHELVDHLLEKHECMSYEAEDLSQEQVDVDGQPITMLRPSWLPAVEVRIAWVRGELLFVLGDMRSTDEPSLNEEGALLVGRLRHDAVYVIHVWHAVYRGSLSKLVGTAT